MEKMAIKLSISKTFKSVSNGVFGELLQGVGSCNRPFLVTLPVKIFSHATFHFDPECSQIIVETASKEKSQALSNKIFKTYGLESLGGGRITLKTLFSVGKGLASSSADLVATARVISQAYDLDLTSEEIESMIRGIEPTDGVMYPNNVSYFYRDVKINRVLGSLKNMVVIGFDEGGVVDTLEYNRIDKKYSEKEKRTYDKLHQDLEEAIQKGDSKIIGNVATYSGYLNQKYNYKRSFDQLVTFKEKYSFSGLVVAHSGTYIGFLIDLSSFSSKYQVKLAESLIYDMGYLPEAFFLI